MTKRIARTLLVSFFAAAFAVAGVVAATPANAAKSFSGVSKPSITGTRAVGQKLTAKRDTSTKPAATSVTYQWYRSGKKISKATKSTFTLTASDRGKKMSVKVCYKRPKYSTKCVTSSRTGTVAAGTLTAPTPTVSGIANVGSTLTANPGKWTSGTSLKYQWLRNGAAIKGATSSTYKATSADAGHNLSVRVTGTKSGYTSRSKTSAQTAAVTNLSLSQLEAIESAQRYLRFSPFSRAGLIDQLEYADFTTAEAILAVDYLMVDWNAQAVREAESYLRFSPFSRAGLIDQLLYEKYTADQAEYGVSHVSVDWNAQAVREAEIYLRTSPFSRAGLIDQLLYEKYTADQAEYGVSHVSVDWNAQAVRMAERYLKYGSYSRSRLIGQLEYSGFTTAEAEAACDAVGLT